MIVTPQTAYYDFKTLHSDIWAYITPYLDAEHLGRLKLTGSKLLWGRLRIPHVVKSIHLGKDFLRFKSWPAFLNELPSIENLSIHSRHRSWCSELDVRLSNMPRTLQKLQLGGEFEDFYRFFLNKDGEVIHLDEQVPNLTVLILKDVNITHYTWMDRLPKSLTNLSALNIEGEDDIKFPDTLIHLKAPLSSVSKLPPGIETLETWFISDVALLAGLPLLSLKLVALGEHIEVDPNSLTSVALLPSTLTVLSLQSILPSSCWSHLPPTLRKLTTGTSEDDCANVTRVLNDPTSGSIHQVKTYPFELLPKSVTFLKLLPWYLQEILAVPPSELPDRTITESSLLPPLPANLRAASTQMSHNSYFPPRLKTLIARDVQLSTSAAKLLPDSLTHLEIYNLCKNVCKLLPTGVTSLSCQSTLMSTELIKFLPNALTLLSLKYAFRNSNWIDENNGKKLKSADVSAPPELTEIGDSFARHNFPHLLELILPQATLGTDFSISNLNRYLTRIYLPNCDQITGNCFKFLPRGLLHLDLHSSTSILDSDICRLPRTLKEAILWSATQLTEHCIQDLPRQMETLYLGNNTNISKSCFEDLPPLIKVHQNRQSFTVHGWNIFNGIIRDTLRTGQIAPAPSNFPIINL